MLIWLVNVYRKHVLDIFAFYPFSFAHDVFAQRFYYRVCFFPFVKSFVL